MAEGPALRPRRHLVVFARAPHLGRVKRRLARDIGALGAWIFYRRTAFALLRGLGRDRRWDRWLALTPDSEVANARVWPRGWRRIGQGRGDIGRRMARPVRTLPPGPVVIVGTDVPGLGPGHVARAFAALGRFDAVLGPAADGGYWLVGFRRRPRRLDPFRGVRFSGPHALSDTLANLRRDRVLLLEVLEDVDDGEAFARVSPGRARPGAP
ncbi:MAG: glycosyltransferase [Proteobacteria bacterium]|nr:glycosyltransferase [Pseudomonadota bacterium]